MTSPAFGIWVTTPILRSVTTAPENPTKDPTVALAGDTAVTSDPETPLVLAEIAACTGNTTASENPTKDPTVAFADAAAVAGDPETSLVLAGIAAGTGDPVHYLGLPLELSPTAHEAWPSKECLKATGLTKLPLSGERESMG